VPAAPRLRAAAAGTASTSSFPPPPPPRPSRQFRTAHEVQPAVGAHHRCSPSPRQLTVTSGSPRPLLGGREQFLEWRADNVALYYGIGCRGDRNRLPALWIVGGPWARARPSRPAGRRGAPASAASPAPPWARDKKAVERLVQLLDDGSPPIKYQSARALALLDDEAIDEELFRVVRLLGRQPQARAHRHAEARHGRARGQAPAHVERRPQPDGRAQGADGPRRREARVPGPAPASWRSGASRAGQGRRRRRRQKAKAEKPAAGSPRAAGRARVLVRCRARGPTRRPPTDSASGARDACGASVPRPATPSCSATRPVGDVRSRGMTRSST